MGDKMVRSTRLSEQVIVLIAALAFVCSAALVVWGVAERREARVAALWTETERDHRLFSTLARNFLSSAALGLHACAVELNSFDGEDLDRFDEVTKTLHLRLGLLPWAEELEVLDTAGAARAAALSERLDGGVRHIPDALARLKRGEALFVSIDGPSVDNISRHPAIRISTPLRGRDGAVIGLVSAVMTPAKLAEELFPGMAGRGVQQILRRYNGEIVAGVGIQNETNVAQIFPDFKIWSLLTPQGQWTRRDAPEHLIVDGPLDNWPLALLATRKRAPMEAQALEDVRVGGALILLILCVIGPGLILAIRWSRRQTATMAALLEARQAAETLERGKSLFFASAGHELRTPLNAILGFSELYRAEVFGSLGAPEYREYADSIHISAQRLMELVDELLDYARAESGALQLRPVWSGVLETVRECLAVVEPLAARAGVTLPDPQIPSDLTVLADPSALRKMLLNLLTNGVKATEPGGAVSVRAWPTPDGVRVTVADTGVGMTAAEMAAALQPFRQVDAAHNRRHKGFGLGLPLVKSLIEAHGGQLIIDSAPGAGARMTLQFPK